jgi:hypothetical protein
MYCQPGYVAARPAGSPFGATGRGCGITAALTAVDLSSGYPKLVAPPSRTSGCALT